MMRRRYQEQTQTHIPLVAHIRRRQVPGLVWWHCPNGAHMGIRQGALMKALGLRPGVSDLCFLRNGQFYALELKQLKGGRESAEQEQFLTDVIRQGGIAAIAHGLDEALAILEKWQLIRGATEFALELPLPPREGLIPRAAQLRLTPDAVAKLAPTTSARQIAAGRKKLLPPPE
jgi:hypothetical protein